MAGDPYGLDADHDGVACESLPCPCSSAAPAPSTPTPTPVPVPVIPPEEEEPTYQTYVACGLGKNAPRAVSCPRRTKVGAFFRSSVATQYKVCVRFPSGRNLCAEEQEAEAGVLYVNKVTSYIVGRHTVTWFVAGRRIIRHVWRQV